MMITPKPKHHAVPIPAPPVSQQEQWRPISGDLAHGHWKQRPMGGWDLRRGSLPMLEVGRVSAWLPVMATHFSKLARSLLQDLDHKKVIQRRIAEMSILAFCKILGLEPRGQPAVGSITNGQNHRQHNDIRNVDVYYCADMI